VSSAPRHTPWGIGHIVVILLLAVAGWLVVGLPLVAAIMLRSQQRTFSVSTALALTGVIYLILYLAIVVVVRSTGGWSALGYRFPGWKTLLGVVAFLPVWYGILAVVGLGSAYVINHGQPVPSNVSALFGPGGLTHLGTAAIVLALLVAAVIAPIVEEALFRGVLYQWLRGHVGIAPAVVLDGLIFACAHLVSGVADLWKLLPLLFVMGCLLAITFQRTGSLFASMLLHGANNALAIVALLVTAGR
jgi:uncharacterized protein